MQKTRVAVLRGGPSEEFDVSLKTGESVLRAINRDRYEPIDIVITKGGEWLLRGMVRDPRDIFNQVDLVFVALHGAFGEDGQVQRMMDSMGVKYTGSRAFSSALAMNKVLTKDHLANSDVTMAQHMVVGKDVKDNIPGTVAAISSLFGPRYIVKPISSGSSHGTLFAESPLMLERALSTALSTYDQVIVEEYIEGKEATCGVVENFRDQKHYALPPIEIERDTPVWGYEAKYDGSVSEICPGRFSHEDKVEIERLALLVHETMGLAHYSRSDFIVTPQGIYFLEVNTLPGMTPTSLLPKALDAVGCTYEDFIEHLLTLAKAR